MTITISPNHGCKRGDVVLLLFPKSDLQTARTRPALVIQADDLNSGLPQVIVCMITSRMFRAGHRSRVVVSRGTEEGTHSGLLSDSVVMTDNLVTVSNNAIDQVIGALPMDRVDIALRYTLAL